MSDFQHLRRVERAGWTNTERVIDYVHLSAAAADQVIEQLLNEVAKVGERALDLCCGRGNVTEVLVTRGCNAMGVDFSGAMLKLARKRLPRLTTQTALSEEQENAKRK